MFQLKSYRNINHITLFPLYSYDLYIDAAFVLRGQGYELNINLALQISLSCAECEVKWLCVNAKFSLEWVSELYSDYGVTALLPC
jgi:hypothetical protein